MPVPPTFMVKRDNGDMAPAQVHFAPSEVHFRPFSADSIWKLGIATTAIFADVTDSRNVSMGMVDESGQAWINSAQYSHPITYASVKDPLASVTDSFHSTTGIPPGGTWRIRIPLNSRVASGTDAHMHVLSPDRTVCYEHFATTRDSPESYTVRRRHAVDLAGVGIGPQNGTRAYGGSAIGGLIRSWEVDPSHPKFNGRIEHPLAIALRVGQLYYSHTDPQDGNGGAYNSEGYGLKRGYVWPATEQDASSDTVYSGAIPMGSYFAIPPDVDLGSLGLVNVEEMMLAKACQDYGVYVTDASGATCFYVEDDGVGMPGHTFAATLASGPRWAVGIKNILKALRVVTNNSPSTPNGAAIGAQRRA